MYQILGEQEIRAVCPSLRLEGLRSAAPTGSLAEDPRRPRRVQPNGGGNRPNSGGSGGAGPTPGILSPPAFGGFGVFLAPVHGSFGQFSGRLARIAGQILREPVLRPFGQILLAKWDLNSVPGAFGQITFLALKFSLVVTDS